MEIYVIGAVLAVMLIVVLVLLLRLPRRLEQDDRVLERALNPLQTRLDGLDRTLREETARSRQETADQLQKQLLQTLEQNRKLEQALAQHQKENLTAGQQQSEKLFATLTEQTERLNKTLTDVVGRLQQSNEKKLDEMRQTVDEKLTATLTQRLDSSFKTVGDQLKQVYESLGEMNKLAGGVNDLQRVLSNVKTRGTWAEVQLGSLLEQTLAPDQFDRNVSIKNNGEVVEFAVRIPSREEGGGIVYLPIDSKFPQEDYLRICEAAERADKTAVDEAAKALEQTVKSEASAVSKYIDVPKTTDFAILFLATEGLYAEVLRRPGLVEEIQRKYRVMICGPTTITAFLNTLRMGFRTIALDKRAAEVWKVLGAAKAQYENFETVLAKVRRKIDEAGNTLDDAQKRNRIITKKLRTVEQLEPDEADAVLQLAAGETADEPEDGED